jgi:hypothetical protein
MSDRRLGDVDRETVLYVNVIRRTVEYVVVPLTLQPGDNSFDKCKELIKTFEDAGAPRSIRWTLGETYYGWRGAQP